MLLGPQEVRFVPRLGTRLRRTPARAPRGGALIHHPLGETRRLLPPPDGLGRWVVAPLHVAHLVGDDGVELRCGERSLMLSGRRSTGRMMPKMPGQSRPGGRENRHLGSSVHLRSGRDWRRGSATTASPRRTRSRKTAEPDRSQEQRQQVRCGVRPMTGVALI